MGAYFYAEEMLQTSRHNHALIIVFLLLAYGCKHQQKQVTVVKKSPQKKEQVKTKAPDEQKKRTNNGSEEFQQKLGIGQKQIKENKLYSFIDEWYGVPYKYAGCQKSGVDCSCFTTILYEEVYNKKIARTAAEMFIACDKIEMKDAQIGDLVFFKIGGKTISHVGVLVKNRYFIHSSTSRGVILNSLEEAYYKTYFFCAGRVKKI